ncbi:hypothetical protein GCM10025875_18320 [Litorihabitans aurantiacus]|uniref:Uncharacterized protein n=1 Tax=Litorihabitans aurantiacus TaxID=1930061 RepID=A0AA38CU50_9MICO|nr:hypothetical protein GCM10025875_18320 [Litorihabitans aurantiacus]
MRVQVHDVVAAPQPPRQRPRHPRRLGQLVARRAQVGVERRQAREGQAGDAAQEVGRRDVPDVDGDVRAFRRDGAQVVVDRRVPADVLVDEQRPDRPRHARYQPAASARAHIPSRIGFR